LFYKLRFAHLTIHHQPLWQIGIRRYKYMASAYYKPCKELDICNELIEKYWESKQYDKCFEGHLVLAEQGYPLAECQIGYFYYEGLGVEKDLEKALYWTRRAAEHGDRDGQYNLAWFYEEAIGVERDIEQAKHWYRLAALQYHDLAIEKCNELGITL
jgi:AAA ATPase